MTRRRAPLVRTPLVLAILLLAACTVSGTPSVSPTGPSAGAPPSASVTASPSATAHGHGAMAHALFEVTADEAPQLVSVTVVVDAASGFNLHIETANFRWAPENVNTAAVVGEGHAHLYVDGVKVARVYGPDFHIAADDATIGSHFRVTLNANDHSEFAVDGVSVAMEVHAEDHGH